MMLAPATIIRVYSCLFVVALYCVALPATTVRAADSWQEALARMPLGAKVEQLNQTNCVDLMLPALQSNQTVKALIFLPGATDELYMFHRVKAALTQDSPSLLDAVSALTNQTHIQATFQSPFLLLHSDEDPLDLLITVQHPATVERLKQSRFVVHALYNDRDWGTVQPVLKKTLKVEVRPWHYSSDSWHFYRHSFVGWNLSGWEALHACAYANKTGLTIRRKAVDFTCDSRYRTAPKLEGFPHE